MTVIFTLTYLARGSSKEVKTFDVASMHSSHREESHMPDDARGSVQIWRVEDYELVDWPKNRYGIFFQGDSYVVLYTYGKLNDKFIIYYWLVCCIHYHIQYNTIPHHTTPYHTIPYHTIPYHTIPTIPYHTIPYLPYHTIPYHTIPYHTIPHHTTTIDLQ